MWFMLAVSVLTVFSACILQFPNIPVRVSSTTLPMKRPFSSVSRLSWDLVVQLTLSAMFVDLLSSFTPVKATGISLATTFLFSLFKMQSSSPTSFTLGNPSQKPRSPKLNLLTTTFGISPDSTPKVLTCKCGPCLIGMNHFDVADARAIPRSLRMVQGFGVNTFTLVNEKDQRHFVKFHFTPELGVHSLLWDEALKISGQDPDFHR